MSTVHTAYRHEAAAELAPRDSIERRKILEAFDMGVIAAGEPDDGEVFQITIRSVGSRRADTIAHVARLLALLIASPGKNSWTVGGTTGNATATLTRIPS